MAVCPFVRQGVDGRIWEGVSWVGEWFQESGPPVTWRLREPGGQIVRPTGYSTDRRADEEKGIQADSITRPAAAERGIRQVGKHQPPSDYAAGKSFLSPASHSGAPPYRSPLLLFLFWTVHGPFSLFLLEEKEKMGGAKDQPSSWLKSSPLEGELGLENEEDNG